MTAAHHHPDRGDDHRHNRSHSGHGHFHAPKDFGRAFAIGIALNVGFVLVEAAYGFMANSMALLADAGHNLSDVLGLVVAWIAAMLSKRQPSARFTYGLRSSSILAALFNAVFLLIAVGAIALEAGMRLFHPEPVAGPTVIAVAGVGIAINGVTAWLFASGRKQDLNIRGAYLHMAADAAVSAGVVAAGIVIMLTGWEWLDPAISLVIAAVIVWGTWSLLRESVLMSLNAVPPALATDKVQAYLAGLPGVTDVHDLHIWSMSTTEVALTVHLTRPGVGPDDAFLASTAHALADTFGIHHSTIQIEHDPRDCRLAPAHVV
jgi:cobalt-zinc-cadmium efflux system protein